MRGTRVQPMESGWFNAKLNPGEYVKVAPKAMADGSPLPEHIAKVYPMYLACAPNGHSCNLQAHQITEHEDGTITVAPSISISYSRDRGKTYVELWHGYLEKGVWRGVDKWSADIFFDPHADA
jgi:hypothetical protein